MISCIDLHLQNSHCRHTLLSGGTFLPGSSPRGFTGSLSREAVRGYGSGLSSVSLQSPLSATWFPFGRLRAPQKQQAGLSHTWAGISPPPPSPPPNLTTFIFCFRRKLTNTYLWNGDKNYWGWTKILAQGWGLREVCHSSGYIFTRIICD